jgi:phosphatidylethanolamine-binding protein (PEBP) family uncharacterized protein
MDVIYKNRLINNNDFLKVLDTQLEPNINFNFNPNNLYSLIFYDPDAVNGTHIHWVLVNITNNDIKTGNIIIPYKGPAPPPNTGNHRYIFELYEQNRENKLEKINDRIFSINEIRNKLNVKNPIFKIQFISKNESGGKKRKRKTNKKNIKKTKRTRRR